MDTFFCGPENKKMYGRDDPESPIFKIIGKRARMNAIPLDGVIFSKPLFFCTAFPIWYTIRAQTGMMTSSMGRKIKNTRGI